MAPSRIPLTDQERTLIGMLDRFVEQGATEHERQQIVDIAEKTDSSQVRNAAAIAMVDLHIEEADQVLIRLLRRPDTKGHRGTLLYALDELNASLPLPLVVSLLLEEKYEGREETLMIVGKRHVTGTVQELDTALSRLKPLAESADEYTAAVGERAVSWLRPLRRRISRRQLSAV